MKATITVLIILYITNSINYAQCPSLSPINLPFTEDFESYSDTLSNNDTLFCSGNFRWTFNASTPNGRAMCGNGSPVNNGGNGAVTFDVNAFSSFNHNELILTTNMSNYSLSDPIFLSFDCNNVADEPNVEDRIYIRGSEFSSWIEIYDWSILPTNSWISERENLQIANILNSNSQTFTSSFQVKFSQYDNYGYSSDGFAIDNISIDLITCPKPQNLNSLQQNEDSVVISWDTGLGNNWNIEYGKKGFTFGQGISLQTYNSTDTITQLESNSIYEFYVQSNCGGGDLSSWQGPLTIYTKLTNDSSCNAIEIIADGVVHQTHNINSNLQFGESFILGNSPNNTIWFKSIVPPSGHIAIETCNSSINTELGAYQSPSQCSDLTTFTPIAAASFSSPSTQNVCNSPGNAALELCDLPPGDTVYFWIGSYSPTLEGEVIFSVFDYSLNNFAGNSILDSIHLCVSDTFNLYSNLENQNQNKTGEWLYTLNNNAIQNDSLLITSLMTYNSNTIEYNVSNTCDSDTSSYTVIVDQQNFAGTPNNNLEYCSSSTIYLFNSLSGLIQTSGTWYDNNNNIINNSILQPNELNAGINVFSYIVDHNSCKADTASFALDILDCTFEHEFSKLTYSVYPNPSNGVFNINLNQVAEIEVFDLTGKKILSLSYSTPNKKLGFNLSRHPKGIYFLRFFTKNGHSNSKISIQ